MAKGKGKRRSEDGFTATSGAKPANADSNALPHISEGALANLTKNIEQKLRGNAAKSGSGQKPAGREHEENHHPSNRTPAAKKGKKRDRNGKVLASNNSSGADKSTASKSKDALEQEIYAIGGTREDYDLLAAVESNSEVDGSDEGSRNQGGKYVDNDSLRKGIAKLIGGSGRPDSAAPKRKDARSQDLTPSKPSNKHEKTKKQEKGEQDVVKLKETHKPSSTKKASTVSPKRRADYMLLPLLTVLPDFIPSFRLVRYIVTRDPAY